MAEEHAPRATDGAGREPPPLSLLVQLFEALSEKEIGYCHWKSNWHLDQSRRGLTDLDILVDRRDSLRFRELLCQQGFKPVISPPVRQYPAMEDYLGYDRESGLLAHLHIHYQLILGEHRTKNWRLPLERGFLESEHTYLGVRIPSPELETIVLTVRALLKYRTRQLLRSMLSAGRRGMPNHVLKEFEYLLDQTTVEDISRVLESQVGFISRGVVLESLSAIMTASQSGFSLYRMRERVRRQLAPYRRYAWGRALIRRVRAQWTSRPRLSFTRSNPQKKTMAQGGMTVAVIGADGAGKSTIVSEVTKWLSWRLTVHTYYMGSKQPSTITKIAGWVTRIFGHAYRRSHALLGERNAISRLLQGLHTLSQCLHRVGVAGDRYRRYVAGQRYASQGALVVYDRYPLEAVRIADRFMDGPQIASIHENRMGPIVAALSRHEEGIYRRIRPPDHLFVLQVTPVVSSQRKPDHEPEDLKVRTRALSNMARDGLRITEIDADQPLNHVLREAKTRLWGLL